MVLEDGAFDDPPQPNLMDVKVTVPYFDRPHKTFQFNVDDLVWVAKQAVLLEFAPLNLKDPLNFGFYMPPFKGRAGKFLDEERPLRDYPMDKTEPNLEFRYKRRIFRSLNADEKKLQKVNSKSHQKKLFENIMVGNMEKVVSLLEKGLDPNFQDDRTGESPLTAMAVTPNSEVTLKALVNYGGHLDYRSADGLTAIHKAAIYGQCENIKCLLDLGASPNYKDAKGLTALYHCVLTGGDALCCELLLNERAQLGVTDHQGSQEIHQACKHGFVQHLEHLIFYGADVNSRTAGGNTPLHICALGNQESCARVLLFRGGNRNLANYSSQSPYEVAVIAGNLDVANLIKDFNEKNVRPFNSEPSYSGRRRQTSASHISRPASRQSSNSLPQGSPNLRRTASVPNFEACESIETVETVQSTVSEGQLEFQEPVVPQNSAMFRPRSGSANSSPNVRDSPKGTVPTVKVAAESGSEESDSDEETSAKIDRRTFVKGTSKNVKPIKANASALKQKRLYASVPGRQFVAIVDYKPNAPGELAMECGEPVEVLYVGEKGFWEGRIRDRTGWFPSSCVQEVKKGKGRPKTWFGKKSSHIEITEKSCKQEQPVPRKVTLKRGDKGYGFQLRGANSHVPRIEFVPSPQFPALQYIGECDKGGIADRNGIRPGDFILEVNGEDVSNATHGHVVSLIGKSGKSLTLKVVTVAPEPMNLNLSVEGGLNSVNNNVANQHSEYAQPIIPNGKAGKSKNLPPPKPPERSPYTCLTVGRIPGQSVLNDQVTTGSVEAIVTLDKRGEGGKRRSSVKGMWGDAAVKLSEPDVIRTKDISKGVVRRNKTKSMNYDGYSNSQSSDRSSIASSDDILNDYQDNRELKRQGSRTSSIGSQDSTSSRGSRGSFTSEPVSRPERPPDYEYALENLRRLGRKPSWTPKDLERRQNEAREAGAVLLPADDLIIPGRPQMPPPAPPGPQTTSRSISLPENSVRTAPPTEERHLSESDAADVTPEEGADTDFGKSLLQMIAQRNQRLKSKGQSVEEMIQKRKSVIVDHNKSGTKDLQVINENEESPSSPKSSLGIQKSASSDMLLQRRDSKGSDYSSLYAASSTSSLDTNCSKDSGIDPGSVAPQAPGDQPPDLASALAHAVARRAAKIDSTGPMTSGNEIKPAAKEPEKPVIEEESLVRPSSIIITNSVSTPPVSKKIPPPVLEKKATKLPPPTRPKPTKIEGSVPAEKQTTVSVKTSFTEEDSATNYLDDVIADVEATIDYDLVSLHSLSSLPDVVDGNTDSSNNSPKNTVTVKSSFNEPTQSKSIKEAPDILTPPSMFLTSFEHSVSNTGTDNSADSIDIEALPPPDDDMMILPPPPEEFLDIEEVEKERKEEPKLASENPSVIDPPPPYSPPRVKPSVPDSLSEKSYTEWTAEDVGFWLDFIKMGQYKETFVENDIQGTHLPELSKDDLSELGVKKLGHRLTIDDAISKLCRTSTEV